LRDTRSDGLLLNGYMRIATAKTRMSAAKEALPYAQLAIEAADRSARHEGKTGTMEMARTRLLAGNLLWLRGDLAGAWRRYQEAVGWLEHLAEKDPENRMVEEQLEEAYRRCGDLQGNPSYFHFGDLDQALLYQRKSLRIAEQLAARDPKDAMARAQLSLALRRMGAVQRTTKPAEAVEFYRQALLHLRTLLDRAPGDINYQRDFANTQLGLAIALNNAGRPKQGLDAALSAITTQRNILAQNPERIVVREDLFDSIATLADIRLATRDFATALSAYKEALNIADELNNQNRGENLYAERCLANVYQSLGNYYATVPALNKSDNIAAAEQWYAKAHSIWSRWHTNGLALPYSANREKEVLRLRASISDAR
jgi:tetratricopeptide (TPR) repeat protein